jgi:hypothetical protein
MDDLPKFRVQDCNAYDMGLAIGTLFASMIQSRVANDPLLVSDLLPFAASEQGERLVRTLSTTNRYVIRLSLL